jgi:spore germination cell wall hydrolase CwlJ-like protein
MLYSQSTATIDVAKTCKVLIAALSVVFGWQYLNTQAIANNTTPIVEQEIKTAKIAEPAKPKQPTLDEIYHAAPFLAVVPTDDKIRYNKSDLFCMAKNIYHEAGSEPTLGKYAVAQVTINRMKSPKYKDTVCSVVFEPYQFSWANYHGRRWTTPRGASWNEAKRIAVDVLENNKRVKGMDDVLFYHATYVRPYWASRKDRLTKIGLHIFYEPRSQS